MLVLCVDEAETKFDDRVIERALLVGSEIPFSFLLQHGEEVDVMARQIEIRFLDFAERK